MEYNLGICLSELGKINESVVPLEKCVALDPQYVSGLVGLSVAYVRLGRLDEADTLLRQALQIGTINAFAKRNLAVVLSKVGKLQEALPLFRQAASLTPQNPDIQRGLAQCLTQLGGAHRAEAEKIYKQIIKKYLGHPAADVAITSSNKLANEDLHSKVERRVRIDAVFYMQSALD